METEPVLFFTTPLSPIEAGPSVPTGFERLVLFLTTPSLPMAGSILIFVPASSSLLIEPLLFLTAPSLPTGFERLVLFLTAPSSPTATESIILFAPTSLSAPSLQTSFERLLLFLTTPSSPTATEFVILFVSTSLSALTLIDTLNLFFAATLLPVVDFLFLELLGALDEALRSSGTAILFPSVCCFDLRLQKQVWHKIVSKHNDRYIIN